MEENDKILLLVFNNLILCIDVNCFIYVMLWVIIFWGMYFDNECFLR